MSKPLPNYKNHEEIHESYPRATNLFFKFWPFSESFRRIYLNTSSLPIFEHFYATIVVLDGLIKEDDNNKEKRNERKYFPGTHIEEIFDKKPEPYSRQLIHLHKCIIQSRLPKNYRVLSWNITLKTLDMQEEKN